MIKFYLIQKIFISFPIPQYQPSPQATPHHNGIQETVRVLFQSHFIEKIEGKRRKINSISFWQLHSLLTAI